MFSSSVIEISRSALEHNLGFFRRFVGDGVELSCVVKGNAYGHGIEQYVPLAEACGVDHFSVFGAKEALRVVEVLERPETRVAIMGYIDDEELAWAIERGIELWVFERARLEAALAAAAAVGRPARIHLELETGLNRTGFDGRELTAVARALKAAPQQVELCGVCTHLAGAESVANYLRIKQQIERFGELVAKLERLGLRPARRHMACSAAVLCYPETHGDLVRLGIAQYGFWPTREVYIDFLSRHDRGVTDPLRRLLSWKTRVMAIKKVKVGEFVGYGTSYLPEQDTRLAVIPVGYASGFARSLSNQGRVLIHGRRASIVGLVNMSLALVNVTNIPRVRRGDEVVLIGAQGKLEISVGSFSDMMQMVNYELLTRLPEQIPRVVVD